MYSLIFKSSCSNWIPNFTSVGNTILNVETDQNLLDFSDWHQCGCSCYIGWSCLSPVWELPLWILLPLCSILKGRLFQLQMFMTYLARLRTFWIRLFLNCLCNIICLIWSIWESLMLTCWACYIYTYNDVVWVRLYYFMHRTTIVTSLYIHLMAAYNIQIL